MGLDLRIGERIPRVRDLPVPARTDPRAAGVLRSNGLSGSYLFWSRAGYATGLNAFFDRAIKRQPGTYRLRSADLVELEAALRRFRARGPLPLPRERDVEALRKRGGRVLPTAPRYYLSMLRWLCHWTRWALTHAKRPTLANS